MSTLYRIERTNDTTTTMHCSSPHSSERSWTIEAIGDPGNQKDAAEAFWNYVVQNSLLNDQWNNPIADGGVEITEEEDSNGRLWTARISWETVSAADAASQLAAQETGSSGSGSSGGGSGGSSGSAFSWYPFISSFSTSGGTTHLTSSYATTTYNVNGSAPNFGGAIGYNGEDFDGVDIPCPSITFDVTVRTPAGFVANFGAYLARTLPFVGTVNDRNFYGCGAGTVLFNGITSGSLKTGTSPSGRSFPYWEMTFNFSAMPHAVVNVCGVAVQKGGWQYLWTYSENGSVVGAYVETVYRSSNFDMLGCGGNF